MINILYSFLGTSIAMVVWGFVNYTLSKYLARKRNNRVKDLFKALGDQGIQIVELDDIDTTPGDGSFH